MASIITGKILFIGETERGRGDISGKEYRKRELVIAKRTFDRMTGKPTDDENDTPKFVFMGDSTLRLNRLNVGDVVCVSYELYGRSYVKDGVKRYFSDVRPLNVWLHSQDEREDDRDPEPAPQPAPETATDPMAILYARDEGARKPKTPAIPKEQIDDLPF